MEAKVKGHFLERVEPFFEPQIAKINEEKQSQRL